MCGTYLFSLRVVSLEIFLVFVYLLLAVCCHDQVSNDQLALRGPNDRLHFIEIALLIILDQFVIRIIVFSENFSR